MKKLLASCFLATALILSLSQQSAASEEENDYHTFSYDLGVSIGTYNTYSYTEFNVGLNTFFKRWIAWRNAAFYRAVTGSDNFYGVDSSVRFIYDTPSDRFGLTAFAGPGYRIANLNESAPLIEGGVIFKLAGLHLGGGVKEIFHQATSSGLPNETILFIVFAGGGAF